jgi:hypothetical protein
MLQFPILSSSTPHLLYILTTFSSFLYTFPIFLPLSLHLYPISFFSFTTLFHLLYLYILTLFSLHYYYILYFLQ